MEASLNGKRSRGRLAYRRAPDNGWRDGSSGSAFCPIGQDGVSVARKPLVGPAESASRASARRALHGVACGLLLVLRVVAGDLGRCLLLDLFLLTLLARDLRHGLL